MTRILHKYKYISPEYPHGVMYAELEGNRYAKVWYDGKDTRVAKIELEEYASAIAQTLLRKQEWNPEDIA